ncbi:hypothetical protein LOD99_935 [Oopsacas minuta]|uniref:Uncharacterized protein n=1 Tax=Oopsacas minuta TaxID=111878 RepID=A0AAV7JZZ2_9METZ|nr:hypothetical protein LOD99_935 [Oopsacas minuta]
MENLGDEIQSGHPTSVTIFQQARSTIEQDVNMIIQSLKCKMVEMFAEINRLEQEFVSKQQHLSTNLYTLETLKIKTEDELGDNSLAEVQIKVIDNLQEGINKISLEIRNTPDFKISFKWRINMEQLLQNIQMSSIEIKKVIIPDPLLPTSQHLHNGDRNINHMTNDEYYNEPIIEDEDELSSDDNLRTFHLSL